MTKLYGFTYDILNRFVIGLGKKCFCFNIYLAKVPKKRIKGYCCFTKTSIVVFYTKHNLDKFRFFGYVSIDKKDLQDK